ncbi:hypothetical protein GCG54_00012848 [Colletotrichum gloeosporioides]|uniref:Uncharacterized protein n=1 Tax=Colletotrichum gloeosporioides TaxID=474922 RepID=A0A8H4CSY3_COLGL|nr:uncharacterized protein GCG54_00012848 [Colletotrichum gloeosporioides]KAF3809563.1 hypothetical protein GCG54_00012848 [Colletotrichum gloeosporioides]
MPHTSAKRESSQYLLQPHITKASMPIRDASPRGDAGQKKLLDRHGIEQKCGGQPGRSQLKALYDALVFNRTRPRRVKSNDSTQSKRLLGLLRDAEMLGTISHEDVSTWSGYNTEIDFRLLAE